MYLLSKPVNNIMMKGASATFDCDGILISGDVHLEFFNKKFTKGLMFDFWFNTQFIVNDFLQIGKMDLDKACKDKTDTFFPSNFRVEVYFQSLGQGQIGNRRISTAIDYKHAAGARGVVETAKLRLENSGEIPEELKTTRTYSSIQQCDICKKEIDLETYLNVYTSKGIYSHWECLKCTKCGSTIPDDLLVKDGKLICMKCDKSFFDLCHFCHTPLKTAHIKQEGKMWHPDCFTQYFLEKNQRTGRNDSIRLEVESTAGDMYDEDIVSADANYNFITIDNNNEKNGDTFAPPPPPSNETPEERERRIAEEEEEERRRQSAQRWIEDVLVQATTTNQDPSITNGNGSSKRIPLPPSTFNTVLNNPGTVEIPGSNLDDLMAEFYREQQRQMQEILRLKKEKELKELKDQQEAERLNRMAVSNQESLCPICDLPYGGSATMTIENNLLIHRSCNKCCVCNSTKNMVFKDSCIYCGDHYAELYLNKCFICSKRIVGDHFKLSNGTKAHSECLQCASCGCNFKSVGMVEYQGKTYCQADYEKLTLPFCAKCGLAISGNCLVVSKKNFHPNCVVCSKCRINLSNSTIFLGSYGEIFCRNCVK